MKKTFATLTIALLVAATGSASAMAANYPPLPPQATVSVGTVAAGDSFTFSGQGLLAGESITIQVTLEASPAALGGNFAGSRSTPSRISIQSENQTLKAMADMQGAFSVPVVIKEAGSYSLTATGDTSGVTVGPVLVTVAASPVDTSKEPGKTPLANTGADVSMLLWGAAGVGALGLGAAGVILARRRENEDAA